MEEPRLDVVTWSVVVPNQLGDTAVTARCHHQGGAVVTMVTPGLPHSRKAAQPGLGGDRQRRQKVRAFRPDRTTIRSTGLAIS